QPVVVVPPLELLEGLDQLDDGGEVADPEQVLFEGPDKAFGDAVALRLPDEARRAGHPQESQLLLEVVAHGGAADVWRRASPQAIGCSKAASVRARPGGAAPAPRSGCPRGRRGCRCTRWCSRPSIGVDPKGGRRGPARNVVRWRGRRPGLRPPSPRDKRA